jgi:hypothetical protein
MRADRPNGTLPVKLLLTDVYKIPTWALLVFILLVLAGTFGLSWRATHRRGTAAAELTTARNAREDLRQSRPATGSRLLARSPAVAVFWPPARAVAQPDGDPALWGARIQPRLLSWSFSRLAGSTGAGPRAMPGT